MNDNLAAQTKKNPAAQALGRLGGKARAKALTGAELSKIGKKGATARAEILTADQRYDIAVKAAEARIARHSEQDRKRDAPREDYPKSVMTASSRSKSR
jgi:hypothetical protein